MLSHDQAFAIAKMRQVELESDAADRCLAKKAEEAETEPERRKPRLFARVRLAWR